MQYTDPDIDDNAPLYTPRPLHPTGKDANFAAGDLTDANDVDEVVTMEFIVGVTVWDDFIVRFATEVEINRYRGFIRLKIYVDKKSEKYFSWFFRKYDVYLVAIDDGLCLYELGEQGTKFRWLKAAHLTGYKESYPVLFGKSESEKKVLDGIVLSFQKFKDMANCVLNNVGKCEVWKESFGISALMISEPARFVWFFTVLKEKMVDKTPMVLGEGGDYEWGAFLPYKWRRISDCARKEGNKDIKCAAYTMEGLKELCKNQSAARAALTLYAWDRKVKVIEGPPGGKIIDGPPRGDGGGGAI
ncbi:urease isoform X2 [Tanacetum coccineum]